MIGGCIEVVFATAYRLKVQRKGLRMSRVSVFTAAFRSLFFSLRLYSRTICYLICPVNLLLSAVIDVDIEYYCYIVNFVCNRSLTD